jgi:hypothetical protein
MSVISSQLLARIFIFVLLCTEFFYIELGGGIARAYHFFSLGVVILFGLSGLLLLRSKLFLYILLFACLNLVAVLFSDSPVAALISLASNYANISIIVAVALILLRERVSIDDLLGLILSITVFSVVWSVVQILGFKLGIILALSVEQETQIKIGFGPSFRTEANTFAKYLVFPFLLFLPMCIEKRGGKFLRVAYILMIIGLLVNFTRTAFLGIFAALVFALFWYIYMSRSSIKVGGIFTIAVVIFLGLIGVLLDVVPISEYAKYKIENLFNKEEIFEGGSSAYRLLAMQAIIENTIGDNKRMILGNGWGQTYVEIQGEEVQAGGADLINLLGFSGFVGIFSYLLFTFIAFLSALKHTGRRVQSTHRLVAEGSIFALIGMFVTGQMSGYLIAPEYYLLMGICVFLSLAPKIRQ